MGHKPAKIADGHATDQQQSVIARVGKRYAYKITDHIGGLIKGSDNPDPIARQYIPQLEELQTLPEEKTDPIGDNTYTPVKGVVHRYPDRVLLKLSSVCAVYCRYCFRREMVGPRAGILDAKEQDEALSYITGNKDIWEVILTGGDPLVLSPRRLKNVMNALTDIQHVQVIRIHTRVPLADPGRITDTLCESFKKEKPVYMVLHVNHAQELTEDVRMALKKLHESGMILLSQSVLLKGINDKAETLETLFRELVALKVKPYYLHHPDLAPGTSHFRLSIKEGQALTKALRGRVSGLCQPTYTLDIPGGHGKVPIGPCYLEELESGQYVVEDYQGCRHYYPPHKETV